MIKEEIPKECWEREKESFTTDIYVQQNKY